MTMITDLAELPRNAREDWAPMWRWLQDALSGVLFAVLMGYGIAHFDSAEGQVQYEAPIVQEITCQ